MRVPHPGDADSLPVRLSAQVIFRGLPVLAVGRDQRNQPVDKQRQVSRAGQANHRIDLGESLVPLAEKEMLGREREPDLGRAGRACLLGEHHRLARGLDGLGQPVKFGKRRAPVGEHYHPQVGGLRITADHGQPAARQVQHADHVSPDEAAYRHDVQRIADGEPVAGALRHRQRVIKDAHALVRQPRRELDEGAWCTGRARRWM